MIRSAFVCLLLATAILPDVATAAKSSWNNTSLDDEVLIGVIAGAGVLFLLMVIIVAACCCCFVCPGVFGCGPQDGMDEPYFEQPPPPPGYFPEQEQMQMPFAFPPQHTHAPEPVYIHDPKRERISYHVREHYDPYDRYDDRRVHVRPAGHKSSRYERSNYDHRSVVRNSRRNDYDNGGYHTRAIMDSPRRTPSLSRREEYY